jgi:hypothetical protein
VLGPVRAHRWPTAAPGPIEGSCGDEPVQDVFVVPDTNRQLTGLALDTKGPALVLPLWALAALLVAALTAPM